MKQKTEILLCESFIELLKKYPFPKITIQMIASRSGVNRQTFYYHFDNVYDLMGRAFEYEFIKKVSFDENLPWDQYMKMLLRWIKDNRVIIKNVLSNVDGYYLREAIYPIIERCMAQAYKANVFALDEGERMDEEFIQKFMTLGITQYTLEWIENNYKETEADIVDHIFLILKRMYR